MELKNYQEDLVLHIVDIVVSERKDVESDKGFVNDVAAYSLNRLPPRYILSERGFNRYAKDFLIEDNGNSEEDGLFEFVRIYSLVHNAVDIIASRRRNGEKHPDADDGSNLNELYELTYWHNFPHIIGKVADKETGELVAEAQATLFVNGEKSDSGTHGWPNPCRISNLTGGFFSFWPSPIRVTDEQVESLIEVEISHDLYEITKIQQKISTSGGFVKAPYIQPDNVCRLETAYLVRQ